MNKVLIAPRKYVQGPGLLDEAGSLISAIGKKAVILWDSTVKGVVGDKLLSSLKEAGVEVVDVNFNGQSTKEEAERLAEIIKSEGGDVTIAVGGGKTLDTAKAAASYAGTKSVTIPTIASNDSPTSSFTVWYDDEGTMLSFESWGVNPDIVMVDTKVIANGPARAFAAGMGDALGTWVEAEACGQSSAGNLAGGITTLVAMNVARLCYDTVMEYGVAAMKDVEANRVSDAVEKVVEANVLMSGLGFESVGVATAHAVANALPSQPECRHLMHGEEVGFGVITQLFLDPNFDDAERKRIVDWEIAVGLPVTFSDIGLKGGDRDKLKAIADICIGSTLCNNHPFEVTSEKLIDAMIAADAYGSERKKA